VLSRWKLAPVYCQAVLCHHRRVGLDGAPAEMVEAKAKDLAAKRHSAEGATRYPQDEKAPLDRGQDVLLFLEIANATACRPLRP